MDEEMKVEFTDEQKQIVCAALSGLMDFLREYQIRDVFTDYKEGLNK